MAAMVELLGLEDVSDFVVVEESFLVSEPLVSLPDEPEPESEPDAESEVLPRLSVR